MIDRRALIVGGMSAAALTAALAEEQSPPRNQTIELRQYTLFAGKRDRLIELFEREFIVPQNEVGAQVLGAFTDLDDPDRFVWLRAYFTPCRSLISRHAGRRFHAMPVGHFT